MKMEMEYRLSPVVPVIDDQPVPFPEVQLFGHLGGPFGQKRDHWVAGGYVFDRLNMFLGNDQNMRRGGGMDIGKGEDLIVFINDVRRYFFSNDLAENTMVAHGTSPGLMVEIGRQILRQIIFDYFIVSTGPKL